MSDSNASPSNGREIPQVSLLYVIRPRDLLNGIPHGAFLPDFWVCESKGKFGFLADGSTPAILNFDYWTVNWDGVDRPDFGFRTNLDSMYYVIDWFEDEDEALALAIFAMTSYVLTRRLSTYDPGSSVRALLELGFAEAADALNALGDLLWFLYGNFEEPLPPPGEYWELEELGFGDPIMGWESRYQRWPCEAG